MKYKYKIAFFIGRFQPFHNGHLYALKKAMELGEKIVIGVGSSQEQGTENNPWSYMARKVMIEAVLEGNDLLSGVSRKVSVVAVPDTPTDSEWVRGVERIIKDRGSEKQDTVIVSNNDWVTSLMKQAGYEIFETGLYNRDELEGTKIREMMRKGDEEWRKRVPSSVSHLLSE